MKLSHTITCAFAVAFACFCLPSVAADEEASGKAQSEAMDPDLKEELDFIEALVENGMSGLAEPVIEAAKKKWPDAVPQLRVPELECRLMQGKFEEVQKEIDALKGKKGRESDYWKLRLKLADAYYFYTKDKAAQGKEIYKDFFTKVTKPSADLLNFYVDSGFRWAQISAREKDYDSAVGVYTNLLAAISEKDVRWSNVALAGVELLLRLADDMTANAKDKQAKGKAAKAKEKRDEYLKLTTKWVDKLLWKRNQPLVFGKAIAMKAHIEMLRGRPEEVDVLWKNYKEDLETIHNILLGEDPDRTKGYVRASPMPEFRYLLAKTKWDKVESEAEKPKADEDLVKNLLFGERAKGSRKRDGQGAYNHALNVYVKYSDSVWAADAADLAEKIEQFAAKRYNKDIHPKNIPPELAKKARNMRFNSAFELFHGGEYEKAIAAYEAILAHAPESKEVVNARGVIAECYVNLRQNAKDGSPERANYEKAATEAEDFVASQYAGKADDIIAAAGNQTLRLAALEHDLKMYAREQALYKAYFTNYPTHVSVAQTAYRLANEAYKNEEWAKAIDYFTRFVGKDPNSPHIANAYNLLASCNEKLGNVNEQLDWLEKYVEVEKKVDARTAVLLGLAFMRQQRGFAELQDADSDPDPAKRVDRKIKAMQDEFKAVGKFQAAAKAIEELLADGKSSIQKDERDKLEHRREQALFLVGENWQKRQPFDTNTLAQIAQSKGKRHQRVFETILAPVNTHTNAIAGYETYLKAYPKGKYGPQALMRIGTIYTIESKRATEENDAKWAGECIKKSEAAFARLDKDFPDSDEAKNSLPRRAKTLIEMGLPKDGAAVYRKMLEAENGKYTAGQFLQAGLALLEAEQWQDAADAYTKVTEMAASLTNSAVYLAPALMGQARAAVGLAHATKAANKYAEARQRLDEFIEKYGKSAAVTNAYDMLVDVSTEMGRSERDDTLRAHAFNGAFGALKKLRPYREAPLKQFASGVLAKVEEQHQEDKGKINELWAAHAQMRKLQDDLDNLDIRRYNVLLARLKAEQDRPDAAAKTRRGVIVALKDFLMAHDPVTTGDDETKTFVKGAGKFVNFDASAKAADKRFVTKEEFANLDSQEKRENLLSPDQCKNLEFCYGEVLPLMVELGLDKKDIELYFDRYMELFGANGAYKKGEQYGDVESIRSKVKGK